MQISLTHTIQGVCCADMTCLWCLRTVMFSFCGYFLLVSCFLWGQRVGKHLICTHSVSLHHNHSLGSNLLLECMQVYLFQKLCSCHIPPRMQTGMIFTHVHALPLVAAVCYIIVSVPPPPWTHVETFWMPRNTKHSSVTGKSGNMAFQWRGKRLVTMF